MPRRWNRLDRKKTRRGNSQAGAPVGHAAAWRLFPRRSVFTALSKMKGTTFVVPFIFASPGALPLGDPTARANGIPPASQGGDM